MKRFLIGDGSLDNGHAILSAEESHHLARVLRLGCGDNIELQDSAGELYSALIVATGERVKVRIIDRVSGPDVSGKALHLGVSVIKPKKMELVLQKCTELGVDSVTPIISERSQGNLVKQFSGKGGRWQKIIEEACKQCHRATVMRLGDVTDLTSFLGHSGTLENHMILLFWEKEKDQSIASYERQIGASSSLTLLFGPEGGFSQEEVRAAQRNGCRTVGLGSSVLRTETAVLAAVSIIQHVTGNM